MTYEELQQAYLEKGYDLIKSPYNVYVLIPIKNSHNGWSTFENLSSLEKALEKLNNPKEEKKSKPLFVPKELRFFSLKEEITHCLKAMDIDSIVFPAKRGEHHCKIVSKTNLDGMKFDCGKHIICIFATSDMFGNKYYVGGRAKK